MIERTDKTSEWGKDPTGQRRHSEPISYDPDLGNILLSAIRYALPRQTGIIKDHIAFARKHWVDITPYWRELILRDCKRELDRTNDLSGIHWIDPLCVGDVRDFVEWMEKHP